MVETMGTGRKNLYQNDISSLALLEAIVDVGAHPERFSDICHDWAQSSSDVENLKSFDKLLNVAYLQNQTQFESQKPHGFKGHDLTTFEIQPHSILLDETLNIISLGSKAAETLAITQGQNVRELFNVDVTTILKAADTETSKQVMGEIFAKDGSRHVASVVRLSFPGQKTPLYQFTLWKVTLPDVAETYIRNNLSLTNAEIDILKLILERLTIASISEIRQCSLNTTRTHINNIKRKFKSHSLTDVISSTHEIIALHYQTPDSPTEFFEKYIPVQRNSNISKLSVNAHQVEYSRYGDPQGRALVILHSLEYGIAPPKAFIEHAAQAGYCIYQPLRPGFGRTSEGSSIRSSAEILNNFIQTLKLRDVTLVALSTAAPTAIKLLELNRRISNAVFVNYAFNTDEKISHIKPVWLRGLLEFSVGPEESFKFAYRMSKGMLRIVGYKTFYRKIYQNCEEDLTYFENNLESFKASANLILSAKAQSIRSELMAAFLPNPLVNQLRTSRTHVISVFGEHTHGISLPPIKTATESLGIPFYILSQTGRNCIYQSPSEFCRILAAQDSLKKTV